MNDVPRMKRKEPEKTEVNLALSCFSLILCLFMVCLTVLASVYMIWG